MSTLTEIVHYTDTLLQSSSFKDYCPNGLQVEGTQEVNKIISGVTASQALLDMAVEKNADMVLVHHGYFWKSDPPAITGIRRRRIATLLQHDINLLAYHLPLDAHPEFGNNAGLAKQLELIVDAPLNAAGIGNIGHLASPMSAVDFAAHVDKCLSRKPLLINGDGRKIKNIAWCTGAAQDYMEQAIAAGADAYLSGEISEQTVHLARESGIHYLSAGHHATERYGVQLLGAEIAKKFDLQHEFMDIDNPI